MATQSRSKTTNLAQLAKLIEIDISRRGLRTGDMYLTAKEVGDHFGAHGRTANRAMNLLADRELLTRRPGVGTFVGPRFEPEGPAVESKAVHVLISAARLRTGLTVDLLISELGRGLPDCNVQLTVLPESNTRAFTQQTLSHGSFGGPIAGVVLIGCPREVQEQVADAAVPAVVFGTVHVTSRRLASADTDHRAMGVLAGRHLAERGAQRIALLLRDQWLPGDNHFFDGVNAALAESGVNHGSPIIRSLPPDRDAVRQQVVELLREDDCPTGLICRGRLYAEAALEAIERVDPDRTRSIDVIANVDAAEHGGGELGIPIVTAEAEYTEQVATVAALLRDQMEGIDHENDHRVLPATLIAPVAKAD